MTGVELPATYDGHRVDRLRVESGDVVVVTAPASADHEQVASIGRGLNKLFVEHDLHVLIVLRRDDDIEIEVLPADMMLQLGWRRVTPPERLAERQEAAAVLLDIERGIRP